uniref:Uncharacterized protein n=1 Tax=Glossina pallidipes TaxID=7398 RepID=A0A1B0A528_GLOPL
MPYDIIPRIVKCVPSIVALQQFVANYRRHARNASYFEFGTKIINLMSFVWVSVFLIVIHVLFNHSLVYEMNGRLAVETLLYNIQTDSIRSVQDSELIQFSYSSRFLNQGNTGTVAPAVKYVSEIRLSERAHQTGSAH